MVGATGTVWQAAVLLGPRCGGKEAVLHRAVPMLLAAGFLLALLLISSFRDRNRYLPRQANRDAPPLMTMYGEPHSNVSFQSTAMRRRDYRRHRGLRLSDRPAAARGIGLSWRPHRGRLPLTAALALRSSRRVLDPHRRPAPRRPDRNRQRPRAHRRFLLLLALDGRHPQLTRSADRRNLAPVECRPRGAGDLLVSPVTISIHGGPHSPLAPPPLRPSG
jgi:hypothetical protein